VESRELSRWDFGLIAPLVAVILFLGVYPQFVLSRSEKSTTARVPSAQNTVSLDGHVFFRGRLEGAYVNRGTSGWTCYGALHEPATGDPVVSCSNP
jgi:hypothetical protein